jgi:hypothetical protein
MKLETVPIKSLTMDPENARTHSQKNIEAIAGSLTTFGQRKPLVVWDNIVIAGNGTIEAAKSLGWEKVEITRVPSDWSHDQARAFALADNRTAELAEWDDSVLAEQLIELDAVGYNIGDWGFESLEPPTDPGEADNPYTATVNIPQYEIVGEQPAVSELFDESKTMDLASEIKAADMPKDVKDFLVKAANRHTVFNYQKIAEFYPHVSPEIQALMERSALVIIDIDDAIREGYVKFAATIKDIKNMETGDE